MALYCAGADYMCLLTITCLHNKVAVVTKSWDIINSEIVETVEMAETLGF